MNPIMKRILFLLILASAVSCGEKLPTNQSGSAGQVAFDDETKRGKELYESNGCAGCHGITGKGEGNESLVPKPRNFRIISSYKQGSTLEAITRTLETGLPDSLMSPYPHLPETDRKAIARYIVYLQTQP
jgi:cytochrome c